jgi:hypothetical protein
MMKLLKVLFIKIYEKSVILSLSHILLLRVSLGNSYALETVSLSGTEHTLHRTLVNAEPVRDS